VAKKVMWWGIALVFFVATVWGLHIQGSYTTFGDAILQTISSKEVVETIQLNKKTNSETKEVELTDRESVQELFDSLWQTEIKKESAGKPETIYTMTITTDAEKEYVIEADEAELLMQGKTYKAIKKGELTDVLNTYF